MRAFLAFAATALLLADQPPDPTERLARARDILIERDKRLPDYTCVQTVDRRYYSLRRKPDLAPICDPAHPRSPNDLVLEGGDRLRLDLKVSQGQEIGSWTGSQFSSRSVFDLIGGGPYGTGMLGALIGDTFLNGGASYQYTGEETSGGTHLSAYSYQVPVLASHYQIKSGSSWMSAGFSGAFWLDADSLELKRLTAQIQELPPASGACEIATAVDYQRSRAGTGAFLLPRQSSMRIVMKDGNETQVTAVYTGCREYHGEATIRFDDVPAGDNPAASAGPIAPLPPGLPLSLALTEPIDTGTAAAGDVVRAKLRKPVREPKSRKVMIPAGSIAQLRIVQMEHWLTEPPHFAISLMLEKLEMGGVWRPLYANADQPVVQGSGSRFAARPPPGQSPLVAVLLFMTDKIRYIVPAGSESVWVTVEPPPEEKK